MSTYTWSIPSGKEITGSTYLKDTDNYLGDTINDLVDFVNGEGLYENEGMTYDFVDKASDQIVTGVKTFTQPIVSNITGNVTGNVTGNSDTATILAIERTIEISGDVIGSVVFDGSEDVNIEVEIVDDSHTHDTRYYTESEVDTLLSNSLSPLVGMVIATARTSVPTGFLECNGSGIDRVTYASLFEAIGTTYGAGNGSTTFNIPNLRGEFIRGWDNGRGVDSGRTIGSWQVDLFKSHNHAANGWSAGTTYTIYDGQIDGSYNAGNSDRSWVQNPTTTYAGGEETRPRNIAMMYCIKY